MTTRKFTIFLAVSYFLMEAASLCQIPIPNAPKLFAAGTISGPADDLSPAFTPDGQTVFFTRENPSSSAIMVSHKTNSGWSSPEIATFSGIWNDLEPSMSPDGSFLVFASNRPTLDDGKPIDAAYHGKKFVGKGGNLWRVDRRSDGWGKPYRLPETINSNNATFSPSIAADGSLYFMQPGGKTENFHVYRSAYRSGSYLPAVPVAPADDTTEEVDPAVAPDESYLVYSANTPDLHKPKRLMITFRNGNGWALPIDLGDEVNEQGNNIEARLGPDGRTLYFSTNTVPPSSFPRSIEQGRTSISEMGVWANGRENIWFVSLSPWLENRRQPSPGQTQPSR